MLLSIGMILITELSTSSIISKYASFQLPSKPKYIVLGHSHPACAFNDSLINNFKNLAQTSESYYYTYFKVKQILEQNPSIETIFIEFTNNQISSTMNNWIWDDAHLSRSYSKYSPFIAISDQFILIQNNPKGFLKSFSYSIKSKLPTIIKREYDYTNKIGGYLYLVLDKTDSIVKNTPIIDFKYYLVNSINTSETNLKYLQKIIHLIRVYKKNVFLIRSPQHPKFEGYENEKVYKGILHNRLNDIEYLDFSNFPLSNSEFGDLEHLNHKGAKIFSNWFNKLIENGLLSETYKQEYINNNIRQIKSTNAQQVFGKKAGSVLK
jgi:hypothetical protein